MKSESELISLSRRIASDAIKADVDRKEFNHVLQRHFGRPNIYLIGGTNKAAHIKGLKDLYRPRRHRYKVASLASGLDIKS